MSKKCMHFFAKVGIAAIAFTGFGFAGCDDKGEDVDPDKVLRIYFPTDYMSDSLIPDFEKQYNAKVIVDIFDSNEEMYATIQSANESYDVLMPSDYMLERLLKNNLLTPLDKSAMTNIGELSEAVKNLSFDPSNNYSIPYFWGNVGIVYDKTKITREELEDPTNGGWNIYRSDLLKTKCKQHGWKVYFYDSSRDAFMIALKALGKSANSDKDEDLEAAFDWLKNMNKDMQPIYVTDEVIDDMSDGTKGIAIAVAYSGDAADILSKNEDMAYFVPSEGTNIWYDTMVIPKNATNPKLANTFINYVMSYEVSLENTIALAYTSPNAKAYSEVTKKGGPFEYNDAYKPRTNNPKDEIYHDNDRIYKKLADYWPKVKSYN